MIALVTRKGLVRAAASGLIGVTMFHGACLRQKSSATAYRRKEQVRYLQVPTRRRLDCAGCGAHIFGSNNTLTLTGGSAWLDMVGSNNPIIVALANGANIEFAGSNNAITWTSPDGKEPVVRHMGSGNTLTAGH